MNIIIFKFKIYIKGYLNSYSNKNNKIHNYVTITKVDNYVFFNGNKTISYDIDGVMLWNGKRCESKLATEEEIKEMEKQLKEADTLEEIISKLFLSFLDDKIELFQNHDIIEMDIA